MKKIRAQEVVYLMRNGSSEWKGSGQSNEKPKSKWQKSEEFVVCLNYLFVLMSLYAKQLSVCVVL